MNADLAGGTDSMVRNSDLERGAIADMRDALALVADLSSQEWQDEAGKRYAATDNQGRRFWFITEDVMQEVRAAIARATQPS